MRKSIELVLPNTIPECHRLISDLVADLKRVAEDLSARLVKLEAENTALKEQLTLNSRNSSQPRSQDKNKQKLERQSSGKASGGQKGHKGYHRELMDVKNVDQVVSCALPKNCACGGKIKSKNKHQRHQVFELPPQKLHVTEYQLEKGCCSKCKRSHIASLPEGVSWGMTGPRLTSLMSSLVANYQLSRRDLKVFMKEQYDFDMSLGTIFNKEKVVSSALEASVSNILERIRQMSVVHMDETGHFCNGKKEWMWEVSSIDSAYFTILKSRGKKAMKSFMGSYASTVVSDRYAVYNHFEYRQLCWAHLKRDFRRLSEKEDKRVSRIGYDLLNQTTALFELWHQFKAGKVSRELLSNEVKPIRNKIGELLEEASYTPVQLKAARFADNLLEEFNSLWRFIYTEGVEPTNNHAERCLRRSVIWRKKYFGTRSESGSQFVSRTASVIATCRLQARSAYDYLTLTIESYFFKTAPPPLLPLT